MQVEGGAHDVYRWQEIVHVDGRTIKELIHEEFGDGIMSASDFPMDTQRQADPKGGRVNVVLSGKLRGYQRDGSTSRRATAGGIE